VIVSTRDAVEITWDAGIGLRSDWVPASDVRRRADDPSADLVRLPDSRRRRVRAGGLISPRQP
jgi:hypothetical protein